MLRAGALTPYVLETIAEDVLRAGPGARLELTVPPGANAVDLARVRGGCARLRARGVQVDVLRGVADDAGPG